METSVNQLGSKKINLDEISDSLLAGLYASGFTDLEIINDELYHLILNRKPVFAKTDYSDDSKTKTFIVAIIQSLIDNPNKKILLLVTSQVLVDKYLESFKKVSSFIDHVTASSLLDMVDSDNIIISTQDESEIVIENLDYIVVDNCRSEDMWKRISKIDVNKAMLSESIDADIINIVGKLEKSNYLEVVEKTLTNPKPTMNVKFSDPLEIEETELEVELKDEEIIESNIKSETVEPVVELKTETVEPVLTKN